MSKCGEGNNAWTIEARPLSPLYLPYPARAFPLRLRSMSQVSRCPAHNVAVGSAHSPAVAWPLLRALILPRALSRQVAFRAADVRRRGCGEHMIGRVAGCIESARAFLLSSPPARET